MIFASFEETNFTGFDFLKKLKYKSSYNTLSGCTEIMGPTNYLIEETNSISWNHYYSTLFYKHRIYRKHKTQLNQQQH